MFCKNFIGSSGGTKTECSIDGDTSAITTAIEGSKSIVLVVMGFAIGLNKHVVQCLLDGNLFYLIFFKLSAVFSFRFFFFRTCKSRKCSYYS